MNEKELNTVCDGWLLSLGWWSKFIARRDSIDRANMADGIAQLNAYAARCPNTKLVISGYSQGAQVVGDIIGGGNGTFFQGCTTPATAGLDPETAPGNKSKS